MSWLHQDQLAALTELQSVCVRQGLDFAIIGAVAYRAWFDDPYRHTEDVDVAIAVNLEEFEKLAKALVEMGWQQEQRREHRWRTRAGARVDLLPAGGNLRAEGRIEWPRSGMVMSLIGFEHVFDQAVTREAVPGIALPVIPIPVLALLKIAAFVESPYQREKDAQDVYSILERYEMDGDRRFNAEVFDAGVDHECAGAFLLGQDLAALCTGPGVELLTMFLRAVQDESTPATGVFARVTARPALDESGEGRRAMIAAFAGGFTR